MKKKPLDITITEDLAVETMKRCLEIKLPMNPTRELFHDPNIIRLFFKERWILFLHWKDGEFLLRMYPPPK